MATDPKISIAEQIRIGGEALRFDIDFEYCKSAGKKGDNHSPSTEGINLFDLEIGERIIASLK